VRISKWCLQCFDTVVGRQEGHPACKKLEWWGTGVVICLERDADLHITQLMPQPLTVFSFSKIQIGFTFLGSPGKRAIKRVCVCVCEDKQMLVINFSKNDDSFST